MADLLALGWMGLSPRSERSLEMALAHQEHWEHQARHYLHSQNSDSAWKSESGSVSARPRQHLYSRNSGSAWESESGS
ncbi:MAG TPA: hypothetical protein VJM51_09585, partial [Dehalococcoidia bacterium]|nr:hypothetical protein [Dehalococcoidia bacterium]